MFTNLPMMKVEATMLLMKGSKESKGEPNPKHVPIIVKRQYELDRIPVQKPNSKKSKVIRVSDVYKLSSRSVTLMS